MTWDVLGMEDLKDEASAANTQLQGSHRVDDAMLKVQAPLNVKADDEPIQPKHVGTLDIDDPMGDIEGSSAMQVQI
ncbi:hypothetical protein NL676_011876 [Syzygium grande]|nr:hypothetical protein NL676_011876 [Syzygium grande]